MKRQFFINKICSEPERPAYSYLVDEYLEDFVNNHILIPYKIINGTKWNIWLSMMILPKAPHGPKGVYLLNKPTTVSEGMVKFYPVIIPYENVFANKNVVKNIVELYFKGIKQFFSLNYKKISLAYLNNLEEKLDWDYILSLPYPVEIKDQHYTGDLPELNIRQI